MILPTPTPHNGVRSPYTGSFSLSSSSPSLFEPRDGQTIPASPNKTRTECHLCFKLNDNLHGTITTDHSGKQNLEGGKRTFKPINRNHWVMCDKRLDIPTEVINRRKTIRRTERTHRELKLRKTAEFPHSLDQKVPLLLQWLEWITHKEEFIEKTQRNQNWLSIAYLRKTKTSGL